MMVLRTDLRCVRLSPSVEDIRSNFLGKPLAKLDMAGYYLHSGTVVVGAL